jgi:hypothetical protein
MAWFPHPIVTTMRGELGDPGVMKAGSSMVYIAKIGH